MLNRPRISLRLQGCGFRGGHFKKGDESRPVAIPRLLERLARGRRCGGHVHRFLCQPVQRGQAIFDLSKSPQRAIAIASHLPIVVRVRLCRVRPLSPSVEYRGWSRRDDHIQLGAFNQVEAFLPSRPAASGMSSAATGRSIMVRADRRRLVSSAVLWQSLRRVEH